MMSNIWLISDTHFFHKNIIKYADRPFADVNQMNKTIIINWLKKVRKDDKIFHLGDIGFGKADNLIKIFKNLPGYKILIRGNHDKGFNDSVLHKMGFNEIYKYPIILEEKYILSHKPLEAVIGSNMINICGHIHEQETGHIEQINVSVEQINYTPISFKKLKINYI